MSIDLTTRGGYFTNLVEPRMMQQYRDAPKFRAFVQAICAEFDYLEAALFTIYTQNINNAVGINLDVLGSLFKTARLGRSDADYRALIRNRAAFRSFATPEDIYNVLTGLYSATWAQYKPEYPAGCAIFSDAVLTQDQLESVSPAGVQVRMATMLVDQAGNNLIDQAVNLLYGVS